MATETLTKEAAKAIEYFEAKLAFEMGPFGLKDAIDKRSNHNRRPAHTRTLCQEPRTRRYQPLLRRTGKINRKTEQRQSNSVLLLRHHLPSFS